MLGRSLVRVLDGVRALMLLGTAAAAMAGGLLLAGCGQQPEVRFANWAGEIGPNSLREFSTRHGIRVLPEEIVDNASLQTKLLTGGAGIDVAVPGSNFLQPLIAAGALQPIDRRKLKNWKNIDRKILALLARVDPANRYGVPYVWGTQAFAYNVEAVTAALGVLPTSSWAMLFNPEFAAKLAVCGIAWQDGAGAIMMDLGLLAIGRDPAAEDLAALAAAEQAFVRVRPYVRYIDSGGRFVSDLASGDICIASGSNGELLQAARNARELGRKFTIRYVLPDEGALLWVDLLVIPRDAPNTDNAYRLIDFLLEPRVAADVANASRFATANASAGPWLDPELARDRAVYPAAGDFARLHLVSAESLDYSRARSRAWTRIKNWR